MAIALSCTNTTKKPRCEEISFCHSGNQVTKFGLIEKKRHKLKALKGRMLK